MKRLFLVFVSIAMLLSITTNISAVYFCNEIEPNNTRSNANYIDLDHEYWGTIGAPGDYDYYVFSPIVNENLQISLNSFLNDKNYHLWLLDANHNVIASSTNTGITQLIYHSVISGNIYYILVTGAQSTDYYAGGNSYSLKIASVDFYYTQAHNPTPQFSVALAPSITSYNILSHCLSAINSWNNAVQNFISITPMASSQSSPNKIEAGEYPDTWYGLCSAKYYPSTGAYNFTISINVRTLTNMSNPSTRDKCFISTIAHEFGHPLGLDDNPSTNALSLMKHNRERHIIYEPQSYDIVAVLYRYPSSFANLQHKSVENNSHVKYTELIQVDADYAEYCDIAEMYNASESIIVCEPTRSYTKMMTDDGLIYTFTDVNVCNVIKGDNNLSRITVKQLGGSLNKTNCTASNVEYMENGKKYLLFLEMYNDNTASLLNPTQAMYYYNDGLVSARNLPNKIDISYSSLTNGKE